MDEIEEQAEELIEDVGEQADSDDQADRQHGRRDPFLARWPGNAPQLGDHTSNEILAGDSLRCFFLLVHQRFSLRINLAGRTGLEPATIDFGGRRATNCATALSFRSHCRLLGAREPQFTSRPRILPAPENSSPRSSQNLIPGSPRLTLFGLPVRLVAAAPTAILAALQAVGRFLFVLLRIVVTAFALRARHHDHYASFFLCH